MNCIPDIHDVIILLSICQLSLLATGYCNEYSFDMNTYDHKSPNNKKMNYLFTQDSNSIIC